MEFQAIFGALEFFGYGSKIINMIKTTYTNFTASVLNNGYFSKNIRIERGVHQGGPNSSFLFLHCAELLAIKLRSDDRLEGIPIKEIRFLLGQYADDLDSYLKGKSEVLSALFENLEWFYSISGFSVNYDKTSIYRFASLRSSNAVFYVEKELFWTNNPINILGVWITHDDNLCQINYTSIYEKVQSILASWQKRRLSLFGKIRIINTLIASLYVYKMFVLLAISADEIRRIDDSITKFLWNNGKSQISLSILKNGISSGGAALVDLEIKDLSLKVNWIPVLHNDYQMAHLAYNALTGLILTHQVCECNTSPEDIKHVYPRGFWSDVMYAWSKFNYTERVNNPMEQVIWNNSHIRIGGRPIFWKPQISRGLIYIKDLLSQNHWKSAICMNQSFGLTIMEYNQLLSAIPVSWKKLIKSGEYPAESDGWYPKILEYKSPSKVVYAALTDRPSRLMAKKRKWEEDLNVTISLRDFTNAIASIHKLSNVPKLRSFQYRIAQRSLVTNRQLAKWKLIDSSLCYYCGCHEETVKHLFVECEVAKQMWIQLEEKLFPQINDSSAFHFSVDTIIFNRPVEQWKNVKNFLVLLGKYYVYRQRCLKQTVSFEGLSGYMETIKNMEKFYATMNNSLHKFQKKWYGVSLMGEDGGIDFIRQYIESI